MNELLLRRDNDGEIHLAGTGTVSLRIMYDSVLSIGEEGIVFVAEVVGKTDSRPIMKNRHVPSDYSPEFIRSRNCVADGIHYRISASLGSVVLKVAAKVPKVVQDPHGELCAEAEKHTKAWMELDNVLEPFGFLVAHEETGTPAVLLMEIAMPLDAFLTEAGPLFDRHISCTKAIARVIFQSLQFIVSADAINLLHRDVRMKNMFVVQSHSLELAKLAVGNFGAAQRGEERADGNVVYRPGDYTWNNTSSRMATTVYDAIATDGVSREAVQLDRQLCLYDDLFGWARIAFTALADRPPPDIHFGPNASDYARIPELGYGDVLDAVHHLMCFALDLLTSGKIDDVVDAEYINALEWFHAMPEILYSGVDEDDGVAARVLTGSELEG